jgi:anti-sigma regulatory factor (Ser/Thr protein kinase)
MRDQEPVSLQLRLQARPELASLLRERVRIWLEDAGADERETFEVLLAITEAFANAVEHPHEPRAHLVDVDGTMDDHSICLSIRDYGRWRGETSHKEDGGMGLAMMESLMDAVRVDCFLDGTTVTMQRRLALH